MPLRCGSFRDCWATILPIPSVVKELVAEKIVVGLERLELSIPKALVSKTSAYAFRHRPIWRTA